MLRRSCAARPSGRWAGSTAHVSPSAPRSAAAPSSIRTSSPNGRQSWTDEDAMSTLVCFGLGYSAEHFVGTLGDGFERIVGTVRGAERAAVLNAHLAGRLKALVFNGTSANPDVINAIGHADCALVSVPPNRTAIPCLRPLAMRWRTRATCARSFICRRSASTAIMPANGSTRPRRQSRARRAGALALMPSARGSGSAHGAAPRSPSCASPASTDPDRMPWSRSNRETRAGSSSPARSSTVSTSPTLRRP